MIRKLLFALAGIVVVIVLWIAISILFFPPDRAGKGAYQALLRIHACTREYAWGSGKLRPSAQPLRVGWPRDLRQLGPDGTHCLDSDLALGMIDGWTITYTPTIDSSGVVSAYALRARPYGIFRRPRLRFYSAFVPPDRSDPFHVPDANGIVHIRRDGRDAGPADSVYGSPLQNFARLMECMALPRDSGNTFPGRLISIASCLPRDAFEVRADTDARGRSMVRTWGRGFDYTAIYTPGWYPVGGPCGDEVPDENADCKHSAIINEEIEAWPTRYGVTGIRSYGFYDGAVITADALYPEIVLTGHAVPACELYPATNCGKPELDLRLSVQKGPRPR